MCPSGLYEQELWCGLAFFLAWRARLWIPANEVAGLLQRPNEAQGHLITRLLEVAIDSVLSILAREFAGDDRFGFQTEPLF